MSRHGAGEHCSAAASAVRVLVVASDAAMRRGLALRLNAEPDMTVIGTAASPAEARAAADVPTVVVLGVRRGDPAVDDAFDGPSTGSPGPSLVLLGLDSGAGPADGRAFVSMHDGDAALLVAIRDAAAACVSAFGPSRASAIGADPKGSPA